MKLTAKIKTAAARLVIKTLGLSPPESGRWVTVFDSASGFWQADVATDQTSIIRYSAVYACIRQIANDIAKLPLETIQQQESGRGPWLPTWHSRYSPVLRKPNAFQTRMEFVLSWLFSLLIDGNTYVLKGRAPDGKVRRMVVLDPRSVEVLVATTGDVFYRLNTYKLAGVERNSVVVPASEIVHHKYMPLNHPLIGCSPLQVAASGAIAGQGIATFAQKFFTNFARPAGVLEAPQEISAAQATELKTAWQTFSLPENQGKVAVLENGLKFTPLSVTAVDAQMLETLKYTREDVCTAFGVPAWKIGAAPMPTANNAEAGERMYYNTTLQPLIEGMEALLDEGLSLPPHVGLQFDLKALLRMDTAARFKTYKEAVSGAIMTPNEARAEEGLPPMLGGDALYLQQQNYSLAALAKRDAQDDPFGTSKPAESAPAADEETPNEDSPPEEEQSAAEKLAAAYRGVYDKEAAYMPGQFVTHGGGLWHCNELTQGTKPGDGSTWTLAVKRGNAQALEA